MQLVIEVSDSEDDDESSDSDSDSDSPSDDEHDRALQRHGRTQIRRDAEQAERLNLSQYYIRFMSTLS